MISESLACASEARSGLEDLLLINDLTSVRPCGLVLSWGSFTPLLPYLTDATVFAEVRLHLPLGSS